jgi:hypothetical protein
MIVTLAKNRDRINSKRLKTKVGEMHAKVMAPSSDYATKPQCYGGQKRSHEPVDAEFKWSSQNTIDKNNLDTYTGKSLRTKSDQELSKIE